MFYTVFWYAVVTRTEHVRAWTVREAEIDPQATFPQNRGGERRVDRIPVFIRKEENRNRRDLANLRFLRSVFTI